MQTHDRQTAMAETREDTTPAVAADAPKQIPKGVVLGKDGKP